MNGRTPLLLLVAGSLLSSCSTQVPLTDVAWNQRQPIVAPTADVSADAGYLRVETDTDLRVRGGDTYYNVRRSYDIYTADGRLLHEDVDNRGGQGGEQPRVVPVSPGQYVIASVYGTVYRKVQVEVRPGATTVVPHDVLSSAPRVFPVSAKNSNR